MMFSGDRSDARIFVIAGASGAGKTSVGRRLADRMGCAFLEGDDQHPAANVAKMRAGRPLDDDDRAAWLAAIAAWIMARRVAKEPGVASCSALRLAYRDRLRVAVGTALRFVLLDPDRSVLVARLAARRGHFMPPSLLDNQLATLERPVAEPDLLRLTEAAAPDAACDTILAWRA